MRRSLPPLLIAATALAAPAAASAHGLVQRSNLPIPEQLFVAGAVTVLVVSFGALAALWPKPRLESLPPWRALPGGALLGSRAVEVLCGAIGVALFVVVVLAGYVGSGTALENLAPTFILITSWVGLAFLSAIFGDVFRAFSPWRAIGRLLPRSDGLRPYPERLGRWPAAAGLLAFTWIELASGWGEDPALLVTAALGYTLLTLLAQILWGVEAWTRHGDAFGVWFGMFAMLAPIAWREDGRLVLRPPVAGAARLRALPGTVGLLVVGIGSTAFDGAKEGPLFGDVAPWLQDRFTGLGMSKGLGLELAFVIGLAAAVLFVGAIWRLGTASVGGGRPFAHTLIPIAAAYVVAHYFSLLAYNGQDLWRLASDPLGQGSDLFGGAQSGIDYSVVSATAIWYAQVGALVTGHVAALVLAHDRALVLFGGASDATRSQVVMLLLMVCFTCLGLWLLSAALNT